MDASERYSGPAILLHWLIAAAIAALLVIGWVMGDDSLPKATQFKLFQLHKSLGVTVLLLAVLRLGWRLFKTPPALPPEMPAWEKKAAVGTHWGLYALIFAQPVIGWLMVSSSPLNIPTVLYGLVPWPHLPMPRSKAVEETLGDIHSFAAYVIVVLVALHAAAALRHHFIKRDDVLWRMLPWRRPRRKASP